MPKRKALPKEEDYKEFFELIDSIPNRKDVTLSLNLATNALTLWKQRKTIPSGDILLQWAMLRNMTVEEMLLGEKGKKYVVKWAEAHGAKWKPPPRIEALLDVVEGMTDAELQKLIEIAKICKKEVQESTPQAKIG